MENVSHICDWTSRGVIIQSRVAENFLVSPACSFVLHFCSSALVRLRPASAFFPLPMDAPEEYKHGRSGAIAPSVRHGAPLSPCVSCLPLAGANRPPSSPLLHRSLHCAPDWWCRICGQPHRGAAAEPRRYGGHRGRCAAATPSHGRRCTVPHRRPRVCAPAPSADFNDYYDPAIKRSNIRMLLAKHGRERVHVHEGNVADEAFMARVFEEERPQFVCHLAARAGVRASLEQPLVYVDTNVRGTTVVLELAHRHACRHVVMASSSSVYGANAKIPFSEDDRVDEPVSPYAATKRSAELLAYTYHTLYGMSVACLRFFTVYGPRGRPDMAPFKFIDRIARGLTIDQYGDGSTSRDYTYVSDIVDGVVRSLDRPLGYQVYNLGCGRPVLLSEFITTIERHLGKRASVRVLPMQPGDVPRTFADVSKARRLLGYLPSVSIDEGLRRTVAWYLHYYRGIRALPGAGGRSKSADTPSSALRAHAMSVPLALSLTLAQATSPTAADDSELYASHKELAVL